MSRWKNTQRYNTDNNNKISFIIYYKKFKTLNLVVNNNSFPPTKIMEKTNVIYQFKFPLGECISDNKKSMSYIGYTMTKLSRRFTLHLSDSSSICQHS